MNPLIWKALVQGSATQAFKGATPSMLDVVRCEAQKLELIVTIQEGREVDGLKEVNLEGIDLSFSLSPELEISSVMERDITAYLITIQAPQCATEVKTGVDSVKILDGPSLWFYWS